jgi:O-glycosyl hydrolase
MDMMVKDLGVSMLRVYPNHEFEPSNENADAGTLDLSAFRTSNNNVSLQFSVIRKAVNAGLERVILSVFSPPAWMKTNNSLTDGGHVSTGAYGEFAEFYAAYVKAIKRDVGIDVYAVSPQNEPEWPQWYESCVYTYEEMRDMTKVMGDRFVSEGISTRIFAAETVNNHNWGPYYGYTMQDPEAAKYLYALAVHAYENDGASAGSPSAQAWGTLERAASSNGVPLWMTETSGYEKTYADALLHATAVYTALKYGDVAAWVYLNMNTTPGQQENRAFCTDGQPLPIYYTTKSMYRWVRPGAVRIEATSDDEEVLALAFNHKQNGTLTVVLINSGSSSRSVSLQGDSFPQFTVHRTSAGENCVALTGALSGNTIQLPAKSITTLYGTGYSPSVQVLRALPLRPATAEQTSGAALGLDGRLVVMPSGKQSTRIAAGVYCLWRGTGQTLVRMKGAGAME